MQGVIIYLVSDRTVFHEHISIAPGFYIVRVFAEGYCKTKGVVTRTVHDYKK